MNKHLFIFLALLAAACTEKTEDVPAPTTNTTNNDPSTTIRPLLPEGWKKMTDFNGGSRANAMSVAIGSKLYIGFGYNSNIGFGGVSNDFYELTPAQVHGKS